ncbi:alpha/beta hydrolase [Natronolimnobius sp. AArcel1]|uniref:alpha/beta fold hydrolase n=1 Tax=Natronolimnobius sp. AArcel1 TaxID=1679093 RepID=UPI0013EAA80C|nr:alpha/beta hydrolase [Natronolimnobius sp. AArcel1]NGM70914.1 alpha/beta hydrolase [Natronolimnobius sp. AArcel1]
MTIAPTPEELPDVSTSSGDVTAEVRTVNGIRLHTVVAGDPTDPLVVFLHGFPECWIAWHQQIAPLVEAGFRVLVPDQRGYNRSEKPRGVRAYRQQQLAADIVGLIKSEGAGSAHVVGHDWGGMVAWDLALRYPEYVNRLTIANAPHPVAFRQHLLSNPAQMRRSWYAYCMQVPWLPERLCRSNDFRLLERALCDTAAPGTFTDADLERYRRAWGVTGVLSGMINWYRASARYPPNPPREQVDAPTLVIWGTDDVALGTELALDSYEYCPRDQRRLELLEGTSHWVQHEHPERMTELVLEHATAG